MNIASNEAYKILTELKNNGPISSWDISKNIKIYDQKVRFYLNRLTQVGIIGKQKSKYLLLKNIFFYNGIAVVFLEEYKTFLFLGCEYYGEQCNCNGKITKECKKLRDLPDKIKDFMKL